MIPLFYPGSSYLVRDCCECDFTIDWTGGHRTLDWNTSWKLSPSPGTISLTHNGALTNDTESWLTLVAHLTPVVSAASILIIDYQSLMITRIMSPGIHAVFDEADHNQWVCNSDQVQTRLRFH